MPTPTALRPWLNWYDKARWLKKARHQLRQQPLCEMCLQDNAITPATVADHVIPHKGDQNLFWFGKLQSLCARHHSRDKAQLEKQGYIKDIGADGWPIDPKHPVYKHGK